MTFCLVNIIEIFRQYKSTSSSQIHERIENGQQCAAESRNESFYIFYRFQTEKNYDRSNRSWLISSTNIGLEIIRPAATKPARARAAYK